MEEVHKEKDSRKGKNGCPFSKPFCISKCVRCKCKNIITNLTQKHKGHFVQNPAETKGFQGFFGLVMDSNKSAKT